MCALPGTGELRGSRLFQVPTVLRPLTRPSYNMGQDLQHPAVLFHPASGHSPPYGENTPVLKPSLSLGLPCVVMDQGARLVRPETPPSHSAASAEPPIPSAPVWAGLGCAMFGLPSFQDLQALPWLDPDIRLDPTLQLRTRHSWVSGRYIVPSGNGHMARLSSYVLIVPDGWAVYKRRFCGGRMRYSFACFVLFH